MKIGKILIFMLFLLDWSGRVEAQRAFIFDQNEQRCANTVFNTPALSTRPDISVADLTLYGWFAEGSTVPLFGGSHIGAFTVGQMGPTLANNVHTLIFRSSNASTGEHFEDILRVQVVPRPQLWARNMTVCPGEVITLDVDSARNYTVITWTDEVTRVEYPNEYVLTVTESRRFSVVAINAACQGSDAAQMFVNINMLPRIDTMQMILREFVWAEICQGCTRRLSDLLILENSDSLYITSSSWTLNDAPIAALNLNSPIGSPIAPRLLDVYIGTISGRLYTYNECGYTTRTLTNIQVRLEISREDCQIQVRWESTPSRTLAGGACVEHFIDIINPRPNILNLQNGQANIQIVSNNNFQPTFQMAFTDGTNRIYRFRYRPEHNDTLNITVTYRNTCCGGATPPLTTRLYFETTESIILIPEYCRTDSLHLRFTSNRGAHFTIDSVSIRQPYSGEFHLSETLSNLVTYTFRDTIHSWRDRFTINFEAFVRYTYCGVTTDTVIRIVPHLAPNCHPRVEIANFECLGDTNFIFISERRRPYAYIVSIEWVLPPGTQFIGELDTVSFHPPYAQFRQRFIAYTSDPIGFEILYREVDLDTLVRGTLHQHIRGNCAPTLMLTEHLFCRGQETNLEIRLHNRNGRLISVDWGVSEGRSYFSRDKIDENPTHFPTHEQVHRIYHYFARFQKTTDLNVTVTYSYGDNIAVHTISPFQHITIRDCQADIWQEAFNRTYCDGEVARFEIRPHPNSENEIVRVVWNPVPFSPMRLDSTNQETGVWHFYTHVYRDTNFVAFVQEVDFWGDIVYYTLSDYIFVQPFPRIWRQRIIDVCQTEIINLNVVENGVQRYWNSELIARVNFAMPPFNNASANAWLSSGDLMRPFVVQAEARYQCASMGGTNFVYDTIYLRWNEPPSVQMVQFPTEGICQNDTLMLVISQVDVLSTITWVRGDETIFRDRGSQEILWDIVTYATYYKVISTTACGSAYDYSFLNVIPAPTLTLADFSVCLYDFATLYLSPDPNIVGIPQWHANDTMLVGNNVNLQIRDGNNPTIVTVLARGYNDCNAKGMIEISPIALPNVEIGRSGDFSDTVSCEPIASAFILNARGDPDLLFNWVSPTPAHLLPYTTLIKNIDATSVATTFRIEGYDPVTGCRNFANFHIVILENDTNFSLDMAGNFVAEDEACIHANFVFEAEYVPYMLYTWRTLYGRDIHSRFLTINNVVPADVGSYRLTRNLHTCQDISWLNIDLIPFPNLTFHGLLPSYCEGYTVEFRIILGAGVYYEWRDPFGTEMAAQHYKFTNIPATYSGDFLLRTMYKNCWHYDTLRVQVYPLPIIDFTPYSFLCEGTALTMNMYRSNATFLWCNGETTPIRQITEGGYYTVTIVENNCFYTASVYIEERPKPKFHLPNDTSTCWEGEGLRIETIGLNPTFFSYVDFLWTKNAQLLSQMESIHVVDAGTYVLVAELDGCYWSDSIRITNTFCDVFIMPTAFRPGSGIEINRTFGPARTFPEELVVFEMFIYDQWGNRKFRTTDQTIRWNGRDMSGRELRPGVYIWIIRAHETLSGQNLSKHGTVTLIK